MAIFVPATLVKGGLTRDLSFRLPSTWQEVQLSDRICLSILTGDEDLISISIIDQSFARYRHLIAPEQMTQIGHLLQSHITLASATYPLPDAVDSRLEPKFDKGTLRQLIEIDNHLQQYYRKPDIKLLTRLYRKLRGKWTGWLIRRRRLAAMTLLYTIAVSNFIHQLYRSTLFRKTGEQQSDGSSFGWYAVALQVAESGVFGDIEQVQDTRFHDIAVYLIEKQKEHDRHIREMKRMSDRHR